MRMRIAHPVGNRDLYGSILFRGIDAIRGSHANGMPLPTMNKPAKTPPSNLPEGVVDGLNGHILRGWAWAGDEASPPVRVEVRDGDTLLGQGDATHFRADLAAAGKRGGHCAFFIALDPPPPSGSALAVTMAIAGSDTRYPLSGSPFNVARTMPPREAVPASADILPIPISSPQLHGSLDQCGPHLLRGWARWLDGNQQSPILALYEGDTEILRFAANQWRADIAELHQGDGCSGFELPLPESLRDGQTHRLDLRLVETGGPVLPAPFRAHIASRADRPAQSTRLPATLTRAAVPAPLTLSIIVNFYNMSREAKRTLASLSRDYQLDCTDLDYEVLCIDNGSSPPLDADWVMGFGPEFRLVRPSRHHPSPCGALNEAALMACGRYLAVMIDGAHVLSPGAFREALAAWRERPEAVIALRQWFIGGDQRWLTLVGYTREMEDKLFDRIRWPLNGYDLFRIGQPMSDNPEHWFDGITETNCLMLPTALYDRIGGFDEAFDQPGGGFANLDLWRRASQDASTPLVALIGEASFHQFHGGTTTNVDDLGKDKLVRAYASDYRRVRGEDFVRIERDRLSFRGRISSEFATGQRQRMLMPMHLPVTGEVRPGRLSAQFDDGAQSYLMGVYAECNLRNQVQWLGMPTGVAPADLLGIADVIHDIRPDAIVVVAAQPGLGFFVDNTVQAAGLTGTRVLSVGTAAAPAPSGRVTRLSLPPDDVATVAAARDQVGGAETVLVLLAIDAMPTVSTELLKAWGSLVSHRSYLVCLGTVFGQPWLGYSTRQPLRMIRDFIADTPAFVIDRSRTRQLISTSPYGYLRKVGGSVDDAHYDVSLDDLAPYLPALTENLQ
ncbi:Glycosyl transferase family 2 [Rhodanobacter glycinis]|uniref:Glycosyl transferase family 2 n=2 Tax=Rhodanobacter glycinis TaxID=582702 RepID=A0A1I4D4X6_9GAMM|nr:Glycosyl transferase family 2 [Rhodanobacter glycinis]